MDIRLGVNTRFATSQIDLRGPDVVSNTLRWLATVEPSSESPDAALLSGGMSDGMGLLVLVTGSTSSIAAAQVRGAASQDETLVVVCATEYSASSRFVVDATSIESMISSWTTLILGAGQAVPT